MIIALILLSEEVVIMGAITIRQNNIERMLIIILCAFFMIGASASPTDAAVRAPAKVAKVKVKAQSTDSIKITWKKAARAKGYQIYIKTGKSKWKRVATIKGTNKRAYTKKMLKGNTKYKVKVRAYRTYKSKGKTRYKYGMFSRVVSVKTKRAVAVYKLKGGYYTAGVDIPAGTFDMQATAGVGFAGDVNLRGPEYTKKDFDDFNEYYRSKSNYKLSAGQVIDVCDVQVKISYSKVTKKATGRYYNAGAGIKLRPGKYKVGTHIPAGRYNVKYISGEGGCITTNRWEGSCVCECNMDGDPKTGDYTDFFSNVVLKNNEVFEVSDGLTVMFIPERQ